MPDLTSFKDRIIWSYANLGMYEAALNRGDREIGKIHFKIRSRLYYGLLKNKLKVSSLFKDEQSKLKLPQFCYYCGSKEKLSLDHIIPRQNGGPDTGDNLVFSCQSCNSSKGSRDLLDWMYSRGEFPSLLVLRRYLKLIIKYCQKNDLMDKSIDELQENTLPFNINNFPIKYPELEYIRLTVG